MALEIAIMDRPLRTPTGTNEFSPYVEVSGGVERPYRMAVPVPGTVAANQPIIPDTNKDVGTIRHLTISGNLITGATTISEADLGLIDGITAGTGLASKALTLSSTGTFTSPTTATAKLTWSITSDSTDGGTSVEPIVCNTTMTGIGGVGGRARFELDTNVALGGWANALKAQTEFGASGRVTGLGSAFVGELILSAGCTEGTYAPLELELGMPANAVTGTETSFMYLSLYGAQKANFDTNGFLFSLVGVTKNTGKLLADTTSGATARPVQVLRVKTPDGTRYLPLYDTVAIAA